ncbi:MAG: GAF domain-containing protein [Planctomycetota bacterium]|nr:GAF domain-containing protein [Planctomycetota bacterium]
MRIANIDSKSLEKLSRDELEDYVWCRLRREKEAAEPLVDHRMGQEPPERFLISAASTSTELRRRIIDAVAANLSKLILNGASRPPASHKDPVEDQQVASIAYLASVLRAESLARPLMHLALAWFADSSYSPQRVSDGEFHVLRAIALLQGPGIFESLWRGLWESGPRSLRGLVIDGWARINFSEALRHLGELLETREVLNVHIVLRGLTRIKGCDATALGSAARALPPGTAEQIYSELIKAGAESHELSSFAASAGLFPLKLSFKTIWPHIEKFLRDVADKAKDRALRDLRDQVLSLLEKFLGSRAWLMIVDDRAGELRPIVWHNPGELGPRSVKLGQGIVSQVLRQKCGYCAESIKDDPYYTEFAKDTKSELAVPVIDVDGQTVRAVLNMESPNVGHFTQSGIGELGRCAKQLLPYILIYQAIEEQERTDPSVALGWHFQLNGWGVSQILTDLCWRITSFLELERDCDNLPNACSFWYADQDKKTLWVRATSGFDQEYLRESQLSFEEPGLTPAALGADRGHVETGDATRLARKEKAKRMLIQHAYSTPVYRPDNSEYIGCFNMYVFETEHPKDITLSNDLVAGIADVIGRIVTFHERLQPRVGAAYLAGQIASPPMHRAQIFDLVVRTIARMIDAEGCSVFIRVPDTSQLVCVATTGLEDRNGEPVTRLSDAVYDMNAPDQGKSFTVHLANHPGLCLRKHDIFAEEGSGQTEHGLRPMSWYRETFAVSRFEHRRFLGMSVPDQGKSIAMIRLNRLSDSKPFPKTDENLLFELGAQCVGIFREWQWDQRLCPRIRSPQPIRSAEENIRSALMEIIMGSRNSTPDHLLQLALEAFRDRRPVLANVREVAEVEEHRQILRVVHFFSTRSSRPIPEEEPKYGAVPSTEPSIGWLSIRSGKILSFDRERCPLFRPIHPDSEFVKSGVNIPLISWINGRCSRWVFCIDFEREVTEWEKHEILVLSIVARQLQSVLSARSNVEDRDDLGSRLTACGNAASRIPMWLRLRQASDRDGTPPELVVPREIENDGVAIQLHAWNGDKRLTTVAHSRDFQVPAGDVKRDWQKLSRADGEYGVIYDRASGAYCSIPLHYGPFRVGRILCRSRKAPYNVYEANEDGLNLDGVLRTWEAVTEPSAAILVPLDASLTPQAHDERGITVWNEEVGWILPDGFEPVIVG